MSEHTKCNKQTSCEKCHCSGCLLHQAEEPKLGEECGVFGMYDMEGRDVASTIYYGLFSLQHRGQESCGIAVSRTDGPPRNSSSVKGMGLVNEVFNAENLGKMKGDIGVGHVRYSTAGASIAENTQPLVLNYIKGTLSLAHNGNLVNALELRRELELSGAIFQTSIDSEVIAYLIARERLKVGKVEEAVKEAMKKIKGAYSLVVASPRKLIGARDPFGFRPLCIGKRDGAYMLSSESCALDTVGAEFIRDVEPGEIVTITPEGITSDKSLMTQNHAKCIFEYIYFARSDSFIDGVSVYEARKQAGRILARKYPVEADMVVGVPESGIDAAIGYSEESGIPYEKAIVKNSYIGRTFIKPSQKERMKSVKIKLNPIADKIKGKRVVIIDDSIVRGTTVDRIVTMLKEAGAKEVHMRISSPPFMWPCYYGTDIPSRGELIACNHTIEEITKLSKADSLGYLPVESLREMIHNAPVGFCDGCFTGNYPAPITKETFKGKERGGMNFDENNKKDN